MKLGFIYDAVYPWIKGGGEKTLYELACALRDRGHECHLFGMHMWDGPPDVERDGLHYHALSPKLPLYGPDGKRQIAQPLKFAWGLNRRLPQYDLPSFDLFDLRAFPFFSIPAFARVRRRYAPQLPWVLTWLEVWGPDYWRRYLGWKGFFGTNIERWAARLGPHHICISPTTRRRLETLIGVDPDKVDVIPCGFDMPRDLPAANKQPRRCLAAGRLLAYKRVDLIVRAWPTVLGTLPDAVLHVVGNGPKRENLERLAGELQLGSAVRFLGELPQREQVLAEIGSAALLLQPSAREGQSMIVAEALSLGTPVLAAVGDETAVGDFLGAQPATDAARLDVAESAEAWGARIVQLLGDPELRRQLVAEGRRSIAQLGWQAHIAPQIESLYRRLIDAARR